MANPAVISHKPPVCPLVEDAARLHIHDLRGPFGWFGSHELTAPDGATIRLRLDVGERHGWVKVEHWPAGARWASSTYDLGLFAQDQPSGGQRWVFSCPLSGVRTPVLYLPSGGDCLGARAAHGLSYRSQRRRPAARAADRARHLRQALGGGPEPSRPRGMHAATFARRLALLASLDGAASSV